MSLSVLSGLIILVLLVIMLIAGVPIAVALGISSVCAILPVMDLNVAVVTGAQRIFSGISVFSLLAIPFFILAGNIMNKGGIAIRLINLAKIVTGRTPGGLAQTNILANALFGAISGSGTAAASAMGSIIGPIEKDEGYDPNFSAAANIATAPTGLLIPPSNVMINIILLVVGTFMDMTPATLIFTPIFLPVCTALGMNTIHFGIMLIFNLCIGTITPPVGTTLFVGVKVGGVKIETVFKHLLPYFFAIIVVLMLVTYIPQLSLWLPGLMGYVS